MLNLLPGQERDRPGKMSWRPGSWWSLTDNQSSTWFLAAWLLKHTEFLSTLLHDNHTHSTVKNVAVLGRVSNFINNLPDSVPTPIANVSTKASKVMDGPIIAMPLPIFFCSSSWLSAVSENLANALAFDKSTNRRKKGRASLEKFTRKLIDYNTEVCQKEYSQTVTNILIKHSNFICLKKDLLEAIEVKPNQVCYSNTKNETGKYCKNSS